MPVKELGNGGIGGKLWGIGSEQVQALQDLNGQTCAEASFAVVAEVSGIVPPQVPGIFHGPGKAANLTSRLIRTVLVVFL
jgi:hypothetical protein